MDAGVRQQKFHEHLVRHFPGVFNYVRRLVSNDSVAEDLTQDAFVKAWQAFGQYDPKRQFFSWVLQIARRTALDYLRRHHEIYHEELLLAAADTRPNPEQLAQLAETRQSLEAALQTLPEIQKTAVFLFYVEELSVAELSTILKKSPSHITVLLHRARQKLKKHLDIKENTAA
jgi:RNA polymerase sigma-70 factor (ECF subfamily)